VTFLPGRGVSTVAATATQPVIQTSTSLQFSFETEHILYAQDKPEILIALPVEV
jgi:hypothetical protein